MAQFGLVTAGAKTPVVLIKGLCRVRFSVIGIPCRKKERKKEGNKQTKKKKERNKGRNIAKINNPKQCPAEICAVY